MRFEFATAGRILFGPGTLQEVGSLAAEMGRRALVVTGSDLSRARRLLDLLENSGLDVVIFQVPHEPTTDLATEGVERARQAGCDLVIGFGGGSAMDSAKAISIMLTNQGDLFDYLEVIGLGKRFSHPAAPAIAIPTTAGTGTEVTRNAVLASPEHRVKVSMRSPLMLPRLAVIDPELTYSMPPNVTASTGLDALTQVIEPYVSHRANPLVDSLCREGIRRAAHSLRRAFEDGSDVEARQDMSLVSLFGGLALANAGLGAVHGFAGPTGGMFHAPHGEICARLLPPVMATNVKALAEREPHNPALKRYNEVAQMLTGNPQAKAADGVAWIQELGTLLDVASLSAHGVTEADIPVLVEKGARASSMKANPILLTTEELTFILRQAL